MYRVFTPNGWKWNVEQLGYRVTSLEGITSPFDENMHLVGSLSDLPAPVSGVITLTGGNWLILVHLDLMGNRLLLQGITALFGFSSETSSITSTGLSGGAVMITSTATTPMQNISITSPVGAQAVSFIGATGNEALDWRAVNFVNCATIGTISGYSNTVIQDSAFLGSANLTLDGGMGTIAFESTFFSSPTGTLLILPATLTVSRRFRIIYSSFVVTSGNTGINLSTSASIPTEGYILDTVNFAGGGTYTSGVLYTDNKSLFSNCKGVTNSNTVADTRVTNNVTTSVILATNTPVKMLGTFTLSPASQRFELVDNKLYYRGAIAKTFSVSAIVTLSSGNNNEIGLSISKNGTPLVDSIFYSTMGGTGRAENVSCRTTVSLQTNDYVDIYVENGTAIQNILGEYASMWVTPATN